ncbi:hypothetical protein AWZ03_006642 [Drosophila navojoa]|uniref:Uncharacterized protein n=1 Tax=Drosophila navojoa TaxID=7232 RepID=A0A484BDY7_DRONA|nr:uncharacterized protein LOC108659682 [Drosophila navojoa]TDG46938.1 hypothetical protein AWZ03_006642 [Drosophila navojoa]
MTRALLIAVALTLLFTLVVANYDFNSTEMFRLGYNPTYDLWYFNPRGRPREISEAVKAAYRQQKPGGICFVEPNTWLYCRTLEPINQE